MNFTEVSLDLSTGGNSINIAISTTSAQSPVVTVPTNHPPAGVPVKVIFTPDVSCFARKGTNPSAVADGTDTALLAGNTYRIELMPGERVAFITASGTGNVKWTPNA